MKRIVLVTMVMFLISLIFTLPAMAQPRGGYGPAYPDEEGGWYCPYCGQYQGPMRGRSMGPGYGMGGRGMMGYGSWFYVPQKLPTPKNQEWVKKLREILVLEKLSYEQYITDAEKFNVYMPYHMVIPQEGDHVNAIERLFSAYGLSSDAKPRVITENKTLDEAYALCAKLERELIPLYQWLATNAEDRDSAGILNNILLQTRHHLVMFEHALGFGGRGMGPGRGMMWRW